MHSESIFIRWIATFRFVHQLIYVTFSPQVLVHVEVSSVKPTLQIATWLAALTSQSLEVGYDLCCVLVDFCKCDGSSYTPGIDPGNSLFFQTCNREGGREGREERRVSATLCEGLLCNQRWLTEATTRAGALVWLYLPSGVALPAPAKPG